MTEEVKLLVDSPPFTKSKVGEGYEAVAGDEPRVELADEEHGGFHRQRFVGFLELRIVFEGRLNLLRQYLVTFSRPLTFPHTTHPLFKMNQHELHEECHVIARVESVPDCEKCKSRNVADASVVEKFESFVYILENPQVRLNIKRRDVVAEAISVLENTQFDVGTAVPVFFSGLFVARHERKA